MTRIAVIGGSGLENPDILQSRAEKYADTPYGKPSSPLIYGTVNDKEVVVLSRHGYGHTIPPSQVNNRANIFALKEAGCTHILATTACGSLRDEIGKGDLIIPDQFIDFTKRRDMTFFEEFQPGKMKHTPMADPFNPDLRSILITSAWNIGMNIHEKGTIVTIEGPRFSTRAESKMFRMLGADIINMSIAPEVVLANEMEIPYAAVAMSTDYDSWKEEETPVSWEEVIKVFAGNVSRVLKLLIAAIGKIN